MVREHRRQRDFWTAAGDHHGADRAGRSPPATWMATATWTSSPRLNDDKIAWYENTDAAGSFAPRVITTKAANARSVTVGDVDGDGDLDVLSASAGDDRIAWYENHLAGDADDDGEVAFEDFATLANNFGRTDAVWEDGDFDGDGAVNFSDFVILADNFGQSRPRLPGGLPASSLPVELSTVPNTSSVEAVFGRFDDELIQSNGFTG